MCDRIGPVKTANLVYSLRLFYWEFGQWFCDLVNFNIIKGGGYNSLKPLFGASLRLPYFGFLIGIYEYLLQFELTLSDLRDRGQPLN